MSTWMGYRLAARDSPLEVLPDRCAHRYNRTGQGPTQYLGLHPLTPWAEFARAERLHERAELDGIRATVWAVRTSLSADPMRIDFDTADEWGIAPGDLVADDYSACQSLADQLRAESTGPTALVVRPPPGRPARRSG